MNRWLIFHLARLYLWLRKAWARMTGGMLSNDEAMERASKCAWCPTMQFRANKDTGGVDGWCGEPLRPTGTSCGCVVLTVERSLAQRAMATEDPGHARRTAMIACSVPDGKTKIRGERCPQGKW